MTRTWKIIMVVILILLVVALAAGLVAALAGEGLHVEFLGAHGAPYGFKVVLIDLQFVD